MQKIISLKQELLDIIDSITPIMFFWLNAVVWSLLLICGYLLLGFWQIFHHNHHGGVDFIFGISLQKSAH